MSRRMPSLLGSVVLATLVVALAAVAAAELPASSTDPDAIMRAVHDRDAGDRMVAKVRMEITGSGSSRSRGFVLRTLKFSGGTRRLMIFESPAEVRNTGLLTQDFDDGKLDDNQWLHLPSLHQTTRIATTRRSGSFVGSDFSFADLTLPDPTLYRHTLRSAREAVDGEDAWLIESVPRASSTQVETGYSRVETWVSQRHLIPLRVKAAMDHGRTKYISVSDVRVIQGIATPGTITARVVYDGKVESQTVLTQSEIRYGDKSLSEADFISQRLERGL